jgi:hypothetical protein
MRKRGDTLWKENKQRSKNNEPGGSDAKETGYVSGEM